MPAAKPQTKLTKDDRQHEIEKLKIRQRGAQWERFFATIQLGMRLAPWVFVVWAARDVTLSLADHEEVVGKFLQFLASPSIANVLLGLATAGSTTAFVLERKRHGKTIEQSAEYQKQLEEKVDPDRSSSKLLPSGRPRKEDR